MFLCRKLGLKEEKKLKRIRVRCLNGFKTYKRNIFYAEAVEGKEYTAILYEETGEYFTKDDKGHEIMVGELLFDETLKLDEDFELIK